MLLFHFIYILLYFGTLQLLLCCFAFSYSPNFKEIKIVDRKKVSRAKLYNLRDRMNTLLGEVWVWAFGDAFHESHFGILR